MKVKSKIENLSNRGAPRPKVVCFSNYLHEKGSQIFLAMNAWKLTFKNVLLLLGVKA